MELFRSEDMRMIRITMQREAAHDVVEALGDSGLMQFYDLSSSLNSFQRHYSHEVRRCEEIERILRYFDTVVRTPRSTALGPGGAAPDSSLFGRPPQVDEKFVHMSLDSMETIFSDYETELRDYDSNLDRLQTAKNNAVEMLYVIRHGANLFRRVVGDAFVVEEFFSADGGDDGEDLHVLGGQPETVEVKREEQITFQQFGGVGGAYAEPDPDDPDAVQVVDPNRALAAPGPSDDSMRHWVVGLIPRDKIPTFELLVYRATRGIGQVEFSELKETELLYDGNQGKFVQKDVFICIATSAGLKQKIQKVCETIGASVHKYPAVDQIESVHRKLQEDIVELEHTILQTESVKDRLLNQIRLYFDVWRVQIEREKAIYKTLNLFDYSMKTVFCDGWVPFARLEEIRMITERADRASHTQVGSMVDVLETNEQPPTHFETNSFTESSQNIVNAYGVPRYKEVNPNIASIVTFPFLFAVMYGDAGHGTIMALAALLLIVFSKKLKPMAEDSDIFGMLFGGRFVVLLMGLFSIYTGIVYNDCFGLSFNLFGTAYDFNENGDATKFRRTYPFGVDPAWYGSSNKLIYYNSLKMKLAVLFGVGQMILGIIFSAVNHINFGHAQDIIFEFIPMLMILCCSFGYMTFMILFKWSIDWNAPGDAQPAPRLLNTMTQFFLKPGTITKGEYLYDSQIIQSVLQVVLLAMWGLGIPCLLILKPTFKIICMCCCKKPKVHGDYGRLEERTISMRSQPGDVLPVGGSDAGFGSVNARETTIKIDEDVDVIDMERVHSHQEQSSLLDSGPAHYGFDEEEEEEEEGESWDEIVIHQLIHTIEFVIGTVSHTASYLRLWALSLAHAQLSEVFWKMSLGFFLTLDLGNVIFDMIVIRSGLGLVVGYALWIAMTLFVLLGMESLSALLHALRLHWVEFQSKFFAGDGELFEPFALRKIPEMKA